LDEHFQSDGEFEINNRAKFCPEKQNKKCALQLRFFNNQKIPCFVHHLKAHFLLAFQEFGRVINIVKITFSFDLSFNFTMWLAISLNQKSSSKLFSRRMMIKESNIGSSRRPLF
jgi:hypothetical protein